MNLRFFYFFLFSALSLNAQNAKKVSIHISKVYEPVVSKEIIQGDYISLEDDFIPKFTYVDDKQINGELNTSKITITKSKKIQGSEISTALDVSKLPDGLGENVSLVKEREKQFLRVSLNPIFKNGSEIIQVEEIEYSYTVKNQSKTRFSKVLKSNEVKSSVLNTGTWYKFAVDKTGVFKLDRNFLQSLGINTDAINPKKIRIFGNGGAVLPESLAIERPLNLEENAILVSGENDSTFDRDDFVLLYGQGPVSWELSSRENIKHIQNIYSNYGYYFINVDSGVDGKRIQTKSVVSTPTNQTVTTFTDFKVHEQDLINYIRAGKRWFGESFSVNNTQSFSFQFDDIDTSVPVHLISEVSAKSNQSSTYAFLYNNTEIGKALVSNAGGKTAYINSNLNREFSPIASNIDLTISYQTSDVSSQAHIDYIELTADRNLIARGKQFGFVNFQSKLTNQVLEYRISNDENIDFIWDVTSLSDVQNLIDINGSSSFAFKELTDGELNKYQVVNLSNTLSPIKLEKSSVENQNLHGLKDVQYVIITPKDYIFQAERLANYHRNNTTISSIDSSKLNVAVVDVDKVYNEFGSGAADITAIRDFVKYLYDTGVSDLKRLKYVCLFGDATFDYKGIVYPNKNTIPVYLHAEGTNFVSSYSTDDYYGYLDANDGVLSTSGMLDVSVGRIPIKNQTDAKSFVDKALDYYLNSIGDWKTKVTLLGDDGQEGETQDLIQHLEDSASNTEKSNPNLNIQKLYTDAFNEVVTSGGGTYPDIKKRFLDSFNNGALVINYFGHGNTQGLGEENFLDISDIRAIRNKKNLPLFITVTCDFSKFDDPTIVTGGEEMITSPFGGAGSMISTSREIFINHGNIFNNELSKSLYENDSDNSIADVIRIAKNNLSLSGERFVFFLGDPAMKLALPKQGVVVSKVLNITDAETENETTVLKGLSKIRVEGFVEEKGMLNETFDGDISVTLFDKEIERKTLVNEGEGNVVEFNSLENKVFVGKASVNKGKFTMDFIIPKNVSNVPGKAKFSFYAVSNSQERIGSDVSYTIGGIDVNAVEDTKSPDIQLFLDDESFVDGGVTGRSPVLFARLNDESGINTSISSIGHDIRLVIDGDLSNPITLNDFYTTEKNDFTKGIIQYDLPEFSPGNHTIALKASDSHNNSSEQALTFFVEEEKDFKISNVLNYPNPFVNYTEFWFKNNRKEQPVEVKVQIYTVSGKLIKTIGVQSNENEGRLQRYATWDGRDDFGNKLGKGVYLYKLTVKETSSGETSEKIEKLVIL